MRSDLALRLATAAVGIPTILATLYLAPAWAFLLLLTPAVAIGALELFSMTHPDDPFARRVLLLVTLITFGAIYVGRLDARVLLTLVLVLPLAGLLLTLLRLGDVSSATLRSAAACFGPLYLGGGLASLALLRLDGGREGPGLVVLSITLSWFSDTGAYFVGRRFGRRKLYPEVSPKKTVEGALGGLAAGVVGGMVARALLLPALPVFHALVLSLVAGALGQLGDLGESLLKRSSGMKDSGGIVPGHGGILDRVDALLVTSIATYLYLAWVRGL